PTPTCRSPPSNHHPSLLLSTLPRPPSSTLFPYTTLFRSAPENPGVPRATQPRSSASSSFSFRACTCKIASRPRTLKLEDALDLRSEEHTSELQSLTNLVCRLLLEKKK